MVRQLPLLRGWAILGVVSNHTTIWVFVAMFWWVHRYRPVTSPNYDQYGTLTYFVVTAISQLVLFSVPAFFFISGLFVTYAARGDPPVLSWRIIKARLLGLLWPFLVWSAVLFMGDKLLTIFVLPKDSGFRLLTRNIVELYFFVPLLAQFYVLSPLILHWARVRAGFLLVLSAFLQLTVVMARYLVLSGVTSDVANVMAETPLWLFVRWAFYFPLGVVIGIRLKQTGRWLRRFKWWLVAATLLLGILSILECEWLYRLTRNWNWAHDSPKLTINLYAVAFILAFLALDTRRNFLSQAVAQIGRMSYGLYLLHGPVLLIATKAVYHLAPKIMAWPLLLQLLLVTVCVGLPCLLMTFVARSPARRLYPYLFG